MSADPAYATKILLDQLGWARQAVLRTLVGLDEHAVRRPMTRSGLNLLGLVKHLTISEAHYLGSSFDRPFPEPVPRFDDPGYGNSLYMWVPAHESRADVLGLYERACAHADAVVAELPLDTPATIPWWGEFGEVTLGQVLAHVVVETYQHAGHADLIREQLTDVDDTRDWTEHVAMVERAALEASQPS
jgi:uncharacterized damage-inducible protein DinB